MMILQVMFMLSAPTALVVLAALSVSQFRSHQTGRALLSLLAAAAWAGGAYWLAVRATGEPVLVLIGGAVLVACVLAIGMGHNQDEGAFYP